MTKTLPILSVLLASAALHLSPATAGEAGTRDILIPSESRQRDLAVTIWYPSAGGGERVMVGENRVFAGSPALADAKPAEGSYPLVVLSHGSGSTVKGMAWLAGALASAGYVVAGPNHPGTTSGHSTPADTPKIWERTDDLSTLVSALESDPQWGKLIDADSIGVVGFSLGGAAAMEFAGATASLENYARYCETYPTMADCNWFAGDTAYVDNTLVAVDPLDLRTVDKARFEQSNRDGRLKSAVLVDPSVARAFDAGSLKNIEIPMSFINLGQSGTVPVSVEAADLARLTPNGTHTYVADAVHYSFLLQCTPEAKPFLQSVGETDPICDDAGPRTRADIHAELVTLITAAFDRTLKPAE